MLYSWGGSNLPQQNINPEALKEKTDRSDYLKFKTCVINDSKNKVKREAKDLEKILIYIVYPCKLMHIISAQYKGSQ